MKAKGVIAAAGVAATVAVSFAAGVAITTLSPVPYEIHAAPITTIPDTLMDELAPSADVVNGEVGPLVDRYGNEVERAVGEYRIDYRGEVYERHSPQTALPRLGSPGA
jgi:hypothetical protein